jgi:iron complex transport system ATP-binding protein
MKPVLEVTGLRVERGNTTILRHVDWRVARGEHWVILGANGSGKTSLLKALTGFLSPTDGEFSVLGRRYGAADWRELRLHIGVVTSAFTASIPLSEVTLDTVISGKYAQLDLWHAGTQADRVAALRLLHSVGLARIAHREWAYLSQGERQRVLIARALMAHPQLLILEKLARRRRGPALVLVTHHVEEITPAFTHALMLRTGRVVAAGPRAEVLTSAHLSATFRARLRLGRTAGRYRLGFAGP